MENAKWLVYCCWGKRRSGQQTEIQQLFGLKLSQELNEHKEIQGAILSGNKTKVPFNYINGLSMGDAKVYFGGDLTLLNTLRLHPHNECS